MINLFGKPFEHFRAAKTSLIDMETIMAEFRMKLEAETNLARQSVSKEEFTAHIRKITLMHENELRQSVLAILIHEYSQLKYKECFVGNERLLSDLEAHGFKIGKTTLLNDLKELEAKGLIKREYEHLSLNNTLRVINTFLSSNVERLFNIYKKYLSSYNKPKCIAIPHSIHEVVQFFVEDLRKPASEAMRFFHYFSKSGWKIGNDAVISWQGIANTWKSFK